MAKIVIHDKEYVVNDGELIAEACEQAGVPFSCYNGLCGQCLVNVLEGEENLHELTDEEKALGLQPRTRLACVCRVKSGIVKLTF